MYLLLRGPVEEADLIVRLGMVMVAVVAEGTEAARGSGTTTMILEEDQKVSETSSK